MTLAARTNAIFDPEKQALHSGYVDSVKFFGKNGLQRLAMFVNVMTRPDSGMPELFRLGIPSYQEEIYPAVEVKSYDGQVIRFEPLEINHDLQWSSLKVTIDGVTTVYEALPDFDVEDELFTKFNNWCMEHFPLDYQQEFLVRWEGSFKDIEDVAANVAALDVRRPN